MNTMKKAHEIRKAAAERWNCKVSEIHFGECLRLAHNTEEKEMKKNTVKKALYSKHDNEGFFCNDFRLTQAEKDTLISSERKEGEDDRAYGDRLAAEALALCDWRPQVEANKKHYMALKLKETK